MITAEEMHNIVVNESDLAEVCTECLEIFLDNVKERCVKRGHRRSCLNLYAIANQTAFDPLFEDIAYVCEEKLTALGYRCYYKPEKQELEVSW